MTRVPGEAGKLVFTFASCPLKERLADKLCASYGRWLGGFRTFEVRSGSGRGGYDLQPLGGGRVTLASKSFYSPVAFNKYGLNLDALEKDALGALDAGAAAGKVLLIDEIGPISLKSAKFGGRVTELLFSDAACLVFCRRGTAGFEDTFRKLEGANVAELNAESWADCVAAAERWLDRRISRMVNPS